MKTAQGQFWGTTEKEISKALSEIKQVKPETRKSKKTILVSIIVLVLIVVIAVLIVKKLSLKIKIERKQDNV